jgi:hypothetical protein
VMAIAAIGSSTQLLGNCNTNTPWGHPQGCFKTYEPNCTDLNNEQWTYACFSTDCYTCSGGGPPENAQMCVSELYPCFTVQPFICDQYSCQG